MNNETIPVQHLRHYGAVYPQAWRQVKDLRERWRKMPDYKDWCYLPLAGAYTIISVEAERQGLPMTSVVVDVGNLGALISWRMTQGIYRFDPAIYESLWDTPLDGDLPIEALYKMPEWCVWIETPIDPILNSPGFFTYLEYDVNTARPELRFVISDGKRLAAQILHLTRENLVDCLEESYQEGLKQAEKVGQSQGAEAIKFGSRIAEALKPIIQPRLSLLLYLCAVNAEIADEKTGQRQPQKPKSITDKKGSRIPAASLPTSWDVGVRIGAAIRAAEAKEQSEPQGGTHASPRAHVRRAHWHTFARGAGRAERFIKWLPPILVNVGDEDLPAVVREID